MLSPESTKLGTMATFEDKLGNIDSEYDSQDDQQQKQRFKYQDINHDIKFSLDPKNIAVETIKLARQIYQNNKLQKIKRRNILQILKKQISYNYSKKQYGAQFNTEKDDSTTEQSALNQQIKQKIIQIKLLKAKNRQLQSSASKSQDDKQQLNKKLKNQIQLYEEQIQQLKQKEIAYQKAKQKYQNQFLRYEKQMEEKISQLKQELSFHAKERSDMEIKVKQRQSIHNLNIAQCKNEATQQVKQISEIIIKQKDVVIQKLNEEMQLLLSQKDTSIQNLNRKINQNQQIFKQKIQLLQSSYQVKDELVTQYSKTIISLQIALKQKQTFPEVDKQSIDIQIKLEQQEQEILRLKNQLQNTIQLKNMIQQERYNSQYSYEKQQRNQNTVLILALQKQIYHLKTRESESNQMLNKKNEDLVNMIMNVKQLQNALDSSSIKYGNLERQIQILQNRQQQRVNNQTEDRTDIQQEYHLNMKEKNDKIIKLSENLIENQKNQSQMQSSSQQKDILISELQNQIKNLNLIVSTRENYPTNTPPQINTSQKQQCLSPRSESSFDSNFWDSRFFESKKRQSKKSNKYNNSRCQQEKRVKYSKKQQTGYSPVSRQKFAKNISPQDILLKIGAFDLKSSILYRINNSKFFNTDESKLSFIFQYACLLQLYFSASFLSAMREQLFMSEQIQLRKISPKDMNLKHFKNQSLQTSFMSNASKNQPNMNINNQYSMQSLSNNNNNQHSSISFSKNLNESFSSNKSSNKGHFGSSKIEIELSQISQTFHKHQIDHKQIRENPKGVLELQKLKQNQMAQAIVILLQENKATKKIINQMIKNEESLSKLNNDIYFQEASSTESQADNQGDKKRQTQSSDSQEQQSFLKSDKQCCIM